MPSGVYKHKPSQGFKKGHPNYITKEIREELSKIAKEKGFGKWMTGRKRTKKWKKEMKNYWKNYYANGGINYFKGKHFQHSEEAKKNIRKNNAHYWKGKRFSTTRNKKISKWQINNPNRKFKNTSIELKIEKELIKRNINYQPQVPLCDIAIVDFLLKDYNIIIQCDGCFWHGCKNCFPKSIDHAQRDKSQDKVLLSNGYRVYRFWEHEINDSVEKCINKIKLIK